MSNNFKRPLASSHNLQPDKQIQQNDYHSAPGSSPLKGSPQFRVAATPFPDAPTAPLPSLPWKAEVPITEQSTAVHAAFPARPPFRPLAAYSEQQVMTLGKKTLFSFLVGFDILANILELAHVNFLCTTTLIAFCTCILLPGFLISLILRIRKISLWENLLFIVGLSIAFLEFGGLLLNILLPLFGVNNPLAFQNIVIGFDIYVLLLFIFAWVRTKRLEVKIQLPRRSKIEKVLYTLPVFFPILAALGAIVLNNGGSDILTLILLGAIAVYSLLLVLFRDKIAVDLYAYAIFFIGIASLFTTSLRSWYITGHDIEREFYVFQLTNAHHIWNMAFYQDAYNACLSITILPTILTNLLAIQDMYVYKVIFQILFATSPVIVFFIMRNYSTPVLAFLSAFFFISFPTFNDMPMINRQEIGFIFFGLVLYMMLLSELSFSMRKILFIIFALSVVVSHYSTNFVLLVLVTFVYVLTLIISLPFVKNTFAWLLPKSHTTLKNTFTNKKFLGLSLILVLFLMTYFWNNLYTKSSDHAGSVLSEVISSILVKSDVKSGDLSYSIFFAPKQDPKQELQDYINSITQSAESINSGKAHTNQFYSKSIISKYPSYPLTQEQLAPTPLGNLLSSFHIPVFNIQTSLRSLSADFMQISVFIGLLAIFFFKKKSFNVQHLLLFFKKKKSFDLQYLLLCLGALFLLVLMTLLPALSLEYGILRMFQQFLYILSLPIVLAVYSAFFFVKEPKRILFTGIIAIIFFLNLTGFISHLTGDYYPQFTLDNFGLYYDAYYVHKSDVLAIVWLSKNNIKNEPVQADLSGANKLLTYGDIDALNGIFPSIIRKNAYVYQQTSIHVEVIIDNTVLIFNSSKSFLDDTKDLVYSNGQVNIYK